MMFVALLRNFLLLIVALPSHASRNELHRRIRGYHGGTQRGSVRNGGDDSSSGGSSGGRGRGESSTSEASIELVTSDNDACIQRTFPALGSSGKSTQGRLGITFAPSTCDKTSVYPGIFGNSIRYYEEIGPFTHQGTEDTCVTVIIDKGSCEYKGHSLVQVAAYSTFDANNMASGYLGYIGDADAFHSFSFALPAATSFYLVGQQILPVDYTGPAPHGDGCSLSVNVEIGEGSCPPVTTTTTPTIPVPPTLPAGTVVLDECVDQESLPMGSSSLSVYGTMNDFFPSSCLDLNLFPGKGGRSGHSYEIIGPFVNPSIERYQCVNIKVFPGTCTDNPGNMLVHTSAYMDAFDPSDEDNNFLGSIGNPQTNSEFGFALPPGRAFYVIGRERGGANSQGCTFKVQASISDWCPTW